MYLKHWYLTDYGSEDRASLARVRFATCCTVRRSNPEGAAGPTTNKLLVLKRQMVSILTIL
jgi:hypothetical protein